MTKTTVENLKSEAKQLLGDQAYEQALQMSVLQMNEAAAQAYESFNDDAYKAYINLQLVRLMGHQL